MKCGINICTFVAFILTFVAPAKAQLIIRDSYGVIQGKVIGRDGNALPNVTVAIDRVDLVQHFETKSDGGGNYVHVGLPAGSYVLSVSDGKVAKVDARLEPRAILNLDLDLRFAAYDPAEGNRVNKAALTIPRKARAEWEKAIYAKDVNPDSLTARINLGASLLELNQYQRALDESLIVLNSRPDDSKAHAQAGLALFELRQYQSAIPHLDQANRSDPNSPLIPGYFLARAHDIMGNKPAAITEYESFLKTHPRYALAQQQDASSVTGRWTWHGPVGWQRITLDLKADGNTLTGVLRMGPGGEEPKSQADLWEYFFAFGRSSVSPVMSLLGR